MSDEIIIIPLNISNLLFSDDGSLQYFLYIVERAKIADTNDSFSDVRAQIQPRFIKTKVSYVKTSIFRILADIEPKYEWFREVLDGRMKKSFTAIQKCISVVKQLATGNPPDDYDGYLCMASLECL
ncbi:hypothetical protein Hdeb2414_s0010g00341261 [Helianthus debilis subsp. tardiflorus]